MKLRPEYWTHHHTHRLFHISLGICFGFIAITLVGGMTTALFNATADGTPKSGDITVTALVSGVNPGPISGGSTGGSKPPAPAPTANPTISIVAEPQGQITTRSNAYVFTNSYPAFSGFASVPNGLVFLKIEGQAILNSTTQATSNGYWYWKSPESLPVGSYQITAAVFDSYDLTRSGNAKANFVIEIPNQLPDSESLPPSSQPSTPGSSGSIPAPTTPELPPMPTLPTSPTINALFGVFLRVLPDYKTVVPGTSVVTAVSLVSNSKVSEVVNQDLQFKVMSPKGQVILETTDTVSFSKHSDYLKTFNIAPATPPGQYTISITATHSGVTSVASDTFEITASAPVVGSQTNPNIPAQWPALVWALLIMLVLMFIVLTIVAYHQVQHHSGELVKIS